MKFRSSSLSVWTRSYIIHAERASDLGFTLMDSIGERSIFSFHRVPCPKTNRWMYIFNEFRSLNQNLVIIAQSRVTVHCIDHFINVMKVHSIENHPPHTQAPCVSSLRDICRVSGAILCTDRARCMQPMVFLQVKAYQAASRCRIWCRPHSHRYYNLRNLQVYL